MLRKLIETRTGPLTDPEFHKILTQVTLDIRVNHLGYNLRTSLSYAIQSAIRSLLLKKNRNKCREEKFNSYLYS